MGKVDNVLLRDRFSTMEEPKVKCASRTNAILACYPAREERTPVPGGPAAHRAPDRRGLCSAAFAGCYSRAVCAHQGYVL